MHNTDVGDCVLLAGLGVREVAARLRDAGFRQLSMLAGQIGRGLAGGRLPLCVLYLDRLGGGLAAQLVGLANASFGAPGAHQDQCDDSDGQGHGHTTMIMAAESFM